MDPLFYTRIAMGGWVFLAVAAASIWFGDSDIRSQLVTLLHQKEGPGLALALLGAIAGIGAPPALGFLLERLSSTVLWAFRRNMWVYSCTESFGEMLLQETQHKLVLTETESRGPAFHLFFYACADEKVLDWARRRRTQMYASMTSAIAILLALLATVNSFRLYTSLAVYIPALVFTYVLVLHALREAKLHEAMVSTWVHVFGRQAIADFVRELPSFQPDATRPAEILANTSPAKLDLD